MLAETALNFEMLRWTRYFAQIYPSWTGEKPRCQTSPARW